MFSTKRIGETDGPIPEYGRLLNGQRVMSFLFHKSQVVTSITLAHLGARSVAFPPSGHVHGDLNGNQRHQHAGVKFALRSVSPTSLLEFWRLCYSVGER